MTAVPQFRDDIQGMRALAVLAVVVFHIWPDSLTGGFLGVDMFFTISGYLITANMLRSHSMGTFSIREFYMRRIKRLLPAVVFLLVVVLCVGSLFLVPEDLEALGLSAFFSSLSAANFYFYLFVETGYFAPTTAEKPLLHLWSLGVEEQFYLIWPLALVGVLNLRSPPLRYWLIGVLIAVSLLLGEWLLGTMPDFSYYMLPTRAYELLAGAMLAMLIATKSKQLPKIVLNVVGSAGLVGVAFCFAFQSEHDGFPGYSSLPITLFTLMLLGAGVFGRSVVAPFLTNSTMRWFGDISYSLYLWHWPVLAYVRYALIEIDVYLGVILFIAIVGLACVSFYFVEKPARATALDFRQVVTRFLLVPSALFLVVAGLLNYSDGVVPWTDVNALERVQPKGDPVFNAQYVCQKPRLAAKDLSDPRCIVGDTDGVEPKVLLWGDSNAAHFAGMLKVFAESGGFSFRNAAHSACPPIFGDTDAFTSNRYRERCNESRPIVSAVLAQYEVVVLGASWQTYQNIDDSFALQVAATVDELVSSGKQIVLLPYIQRHSSLNRSCAARGVQLSFIDCQSLYTRPGPSLYEMNTQLAALAQTNPNVHFFDANQYLCPEGVCSAFLGSDLIYFDNGHFSATGSELFGEHIVKTSGLPDFAKLLGAAN